MAIDPKKAAESPSKAARKGSGDSPGKVHDASSSAAAAASSSQHPPTLAPFTESQVLAITNSIQFQRAIEAQLNTALHACVSGVLRAELPAAVQALLDEQRLSIQTMLDNANSNLDGKFKEALFAVQTNNAAAMAVDGAGSPEHDEALREVRAVGEKFDDFNARLAKLEIAPHPSISADGSAA